MAKPFRPTAVPLITTDPYFSIWSFSDRLSDDYPRHWTGRTQSAVGVLVIDGVPYRFLGKAAPAESYIPDSKILKQVSLTVSPTSSVYRFSHPFCELTVTFLTPLLLDRPEVFSRPVSYIFYEIKPREAGHTFRFYLDFSAELCGDNHGQKMVLREEKGHAVMGNAVQNVLNACGDDVRIDWGYLHLLHENAKIGHGEYRYRYFKKRVSERRLKSVDLTQPVPFSRMPLLYVESEKLTDRILVAYDDVKSIDYFHHPADAYYKSVYGDFETMLAVADREADTLRAECAAFDRKLLAMMRKISPDYARVGALTYRQAIAAHKLISVDGKPVFLSKECFSNGCIATLDVTYPSIPLFLVFNPELVRGMLRPLFAFARTPVWEFPYAPHDCGCYPFCNGQVYSAKDGKMLPDDQMPVEECGNAILCVAAVTKADGDRTFAEENRDLLRTWADYLVKYGYDPDNQLCTDDFAGHLAHNCNLSLKAITALGAYAQLFHEPSYAKVAKEMADRWCQEAKRSCGDGWRLTFDRDDSWSMKYNIIWDRLLGLNLFDGSVTVGEVALYREKMNRYGVPLDSRADYTKIDWMAWTTVMTDDKEYTQSVYTAARRMVEESADRVPVTDWYDTVDARQMNFQARSVLGGFYINLLRDLWLG